MVSSPSDNGVTSSNNTSLYYPPDIGLYRGASATTSSGFTVSFTGFPKIPTPFFTRVPGAAAHHHHFLYVALRQACIFQGMAARCYGTFEYLMMRDSNVDLVTESCMPS